MTQPITPEQLKVLMSDLNRNRVKSRSQAGRSFSYLEGYDVKATLIRVFGFGGVLRRGPVQRSRGQA